MNIVDADIKDIAPEMNKSLHVTNLDVIFDRKLPFLLLQILQVDWVDPGKDGKMTQDW